MNLVQAASLAAPAPVLGAAEFLTPSARSERCRQLAADGYLVARVVPPPANDHPEPPASAGRLRDALEAAVEISLALRGALPPSVEIDAPAADMADDQLFRLHRLGARGLCVVLPPLSELVDARGVLSAADSITLSVWKEMTEREPVVLLFDAGDRDLGMLAPTPLSGIFEQNRPSWPDDERSVDCVADDAGDEDENEHDDPLLHPEPETLVQLDDDDDAPDPPAVHQIWHRDSIDALELLAERDQRHEDPPAEPTEPVVPSVHPPLPKPPRRPPPVMPEPEVREHSAALAEAQGPRPVRHVEELFRSHYVPLAGALLRGLRDAEAEEAVAEWQRSFGHSYAESFTHMRLTGKRPNMVLDVPDMAARTARLHGARGVQLVLVDGMRFDLGELVQEKLRDTIGERAVCLAHDLLWSALPTITPTQLRLLAQGPRGLGEPEPTSDRDPPIHRAGSVTTLRRVRIGQRDLLKLDVVEARLRDAGPAFGERMDHIAAEVVEAIAHLCESLAPRTLLYLFGDHGFTIEATAGATGPAAQGGTSPEEALVPGYAWLIGEPH